MISICFLLLCCLAGYVDSWGQSGSFKDLKSKFNSVPSQYRPAPFWVWNYKVTKPEIDRMLAEFKENGFGGVFVHPRYGMVTEYLSDEWFDLYTYAIQEGEKLGLDIWLYDENAYPSGFAGGLLPSQMPESYTQGQGLDPLEVTILPNDYRSFLVILSDEEGQYKDITALADTYLGKQGQYILYKKTFYPDNTQPSRAWYAGFSYTDLLLSGVTEKFIEITMSGYEKHYRSKFGKSIKGVFSDEVNIRSSGGFRWTPDLFDIFRKEYGYDLCINLPSLHLPVGNWKKVRYDYSRLLLNLFIERWAKPWYEYCTKNNLIWTGHYWEQTWPGIEQVPDNMAMNAWQQMPGVDMLSNIFDEESTSAMFGNVRVVKEAKSAANQLGRERLLCEAYGGGGWNMNFRDFKRHSDWLNVMGVNFLNQHLSHMSFVGVRKYDWPPMFCSMAPWWDDYKVLNEYQARLSFAMSQGKEENRILVLEPTTTTWMYAQHIGKDGNIVAKNIAGSFQHFITKLSKNQIEYDLGCENIIVNNGKVKSGKFIVGECVYSIVVIPELVENMDGTCFSLLQQFVEQGGIVVTYSSPVYVDGTKSEEIINFFSDKRIIHFENAAGEQVPERLQSPEIRFDKQEGGNLFHHRKKLEDGELLLLTNSSLVENSVFSVEINGKSVVELDPFSRKLYTYPPTKKNGKLVFSGDLPPAGSLLLFISKSEEKGYEKRRSPSKIIRIQASDTIKISRMKDNVLIIDYLDLEQQDSVSKSRYFMDANFDVFKNAGFKEGNPWFRSVQFKQDIINRDVSDAPDFTAIYSFEVLKELSDFSSFKLLCERAPLYTIKVNGHILNTKGEMFLDKDFSLYPISLFLHKGINKIEMSVNKFSVEAEIEPVYILGDFSVIARDNKWAITGKQDYKCLETTQKLGAPFYPWEMCYMNSYEIDRKDTYWISVPGWKGSVAQVWVNGRKAGILLSDPYRLEVTNFMKQGKNTVEIRVLGSMDNFFGPHHSRSKGMTPPWDWQKHDGKPNADGYILTDYGLLKDFELFQIKYK